CSPKLRARNRYNRHVGQNDMGLRAVSWRRPAEKPRSSASELPSVALVNMPTRARNPSGRGTARKASSSQWSCGHVAARPGFVTRSKRFAESLGPGNDKIKSGDIDANTLHECPSARVA